MNCDLPTSGVPSERPPKAAASLDKRTELQSGPWLLSMYPDAHEAVIVGACPHTDLAVDDGELGEVWADDPLRSVWSDLEAEEKAAQNHERATRRARTASRRYMVANRLVFMWVLTFAGEGVEATAEGRRRCMGLVAEFARRLTSAFGRMPYWYSPEIHPDGHGWHVNFFVGRRLPHDRVAAMWGHGFVYVTDWTKKKWIQRLGLPFVEAVRKAATYGCKYAQKDWGGEVLDEGAHRYEVAQGFAPKKVTMRLSTVAEAMKIARMRFHGQTVRTWFSDESPDWDGPLVICLTFTPHGEPPGSDDVDRA